MPQKYLVTGGLGFIGSSLVCALVRRGDTVRVFDNSSRGSQEKLREVVGDVEVIEGDIRDAYAVSRAAEGIGSVIHLAYVNGTEYFYTKPAYVLEVGVKGIINVIDACKAHGVPELVLASSSEVYQTPPRVPTDESVPLSVPDPLNPRYSYGGGKIISELLVLNEGRADFERVLVFRPHNVYGPAMGYEHVIPQFICRMQKLVESGAKGPLPFPIQGDGSQTRAFICIDDFTEGLMLVLAKGQHLGIYHIGTMEEVTIADLAQRIARVFGREITLQPGKEAAGGTRRRCADNGKIRALGFAQKVPLDEGLEPTVAWYREHPER